MNRAIVWFRQDLRLTDNEAIIEATKHADEVLYVYVFEDEFTKSFSKHGFRRTGIHRLKFIIESVEDLRNNLRLRGADLIIRCGKTEDEVFNIANQFKSTWVFCNRERTRDEVSIQDELERKLWSVGQELRYARGKMLYYTQDLPFPITHTPDVFTQFRKEVEKITPVREPLEVPKDLKFKGNDIRTGELPELSDFGYFDYEFDKRSAHPFKGGETSGLERLQHYIWESQNILSYSDRRNDLIGTNYSSKFSAYLSQGCLSPKTIFYEIKKFELKYGESKSTYHLIFELLWRDFFRLTGKKHLNQIFKKEGINRKGQQSFMHDQVKIDEWIEGRTGQPFIDANMRELKATGFMSNRGRQNVASYFVHDLMQNWQIGAEYFECMLVDYDVCSNWCNWNYIAGIGNDPRENRVFNIATQSQKYDPKGEYVALWLKDEQQTVC